MLVFVALAVVLPEAYGADVEEVVESSVVAAGTEKLVGLRDVCFVVIRVGVGFGAIPSDSWQDSCCVRLLRREDASIA